MRPSSWRSCPPGCPKSVVRSSAHCFRLLSPTSPREKVKGRNPKPRQDSLHEKLNARAMQFTFISRFQRGTYRAATLGSQNDEERRVKMRTRILQTGGNLRREDVAGDAHDEQLSEAGIEN